VWAGAISREAALRDVIPVGHESDNLVDIYMPPVAGKHYTLGIDSADDSQTVVRGSENAIVVIDDDTGDQVAQWHGFTDTFTAAAVGAALHQLYNRARIVIEIDSAGKAVLGFMREVFNCSNFWMRRQVDQRTKKVNNLIGFRSHDKTQAVLKSTWIEAVKGRTAKNYSGELADQALTFSRRGGVFNQHQAQDGERDDLVMAWMLAIYGCSTRDRWIPQLVRSYADSPIVTTHRRGIVWADLERRPGRATYHGLTRT
jgi:hypothetical protein